MNSVRADEKERNEKHMKQRAEVKSFAKEIVETCKSKGFTIRQLQMLKDEISEEINDFLIDKYLETSL